MKKLLLVVVFIVSATFLTSAQCGRITPHLSYAYPGYFVKSDIYALCGDITAFNDDPRAELPTGKQGLVWAQANIFSYSMQRVGMDEAFIFTVGGVVHADTVFASMYYEAKNYSGLESTGNRHFRITVYDADGNWIATKGSADAPPKWFLLDPGQFYFFIFEFSPYYNPYVLPQKRKKTLRAPGFAAFPFVWYK